MRSYLEQIAGRIPDADWAMLNGILEEATAARGDFLLEQNAVCRTIWYLEHGAARFFELVEGEEMTTHFFTAPSFFTSYHSLIGGAPSDLFIRAEEDCRLVELPYPLLAGLYRRSHALEHIGRVMAEMQFMMEFDRRRMHLNMDALQRYEHLEKTQPDVFQRFQLKDIATYLGITPVSLSRLRKYRFEKNK